MRPLSISVSIYAATVVSLAGVNWGWCADTPTGAQLQGEIKKERMDSGSNENVQDPFAQDSAPGENEIETEKSETNVLTGGVESSFYSQAVSYEERGDLPNALENYVLAINNDPSNKLIRKRLQTLELKIKRQHPAFHAYTSYYTNLRDARLLLNYGVRMYSMGWYQQAKNLFKRAAKLDAENPNSFFNLGVIYEREAQLPEALSNYRKSVSLFKRHGADLPISAADSRSRRNARATRLKGSISKLGQERRRYSGMEDPDNGPKLAQEAVNSILKQMQGKPDDRKWPVLDVSKPLRAHYPPGTGHVDTCDRCLILRYVEMRPN